MTEPLSILGSVAAAADLITMLCKTIQTVSDLRRQWRDADMTVYAFEVELVALKAALQQIAEWMDAAFEDPYHQLVIDLDCCLSCCGMLVQLVDAELTSLFGNGSDQLDGAAKLRLLFKSKAISDAQGMIERQKSALTLLLTACNG